MSEQAGAPRGTGTTIRDALRAGGEVGEDLLAVDWSATPLGPPETWPQSLATMVRVLIASRFSMWMAWGPELTFFCNEAYRRDTLAKKYPWALGRPAREVWAEIWPDIGPRIEAVLTSGVATWDESLQLFLERSGYVEETYHTFSYSPLIDDAGAVAGMLCVVSEDTDRVIAERRMATLRDLGAATTTARNDAQVLTAAADLLATERRDLPFTLVYLLDDDGAAHLTAATGITAGHPAAPVAISSVDPDPVWPLRDVTDGGSVLVGGLADRFPDLPSGAWTEPPTDALLVPLPDQGGASPYGFLLVGLNRYRPLDEGYRGFIDLIAGQLAAGVSSARAYESERRRAESLAELDRAKTAFFTNVSHEFRTPLTLMLGPAEDALADRVHELPPEQRQRVAVLHRNAQRLLKLVNALLDFSRLEAGGDTARFEAVELALYTAELASMFRPAIERAGLGLTIDCPPLPEPVYVDREMWAKIVLNLLSNALKFTFTGGITVRLRSAAGRVELAVTDTGVGIEPADQVRLFERFQRVAGVRARSHEGSGIGLALVAELAAVHGGDAAVTSAPRSGSTFTVRLRTGTAHLPPERIADRIAEPGDAADTDAVEGFLAEAMRWMEPAGGAAAEPAGGPVAEPAAATRTAGGELAHRPRVLVVDDNADMRDYLVALLSDSYRVQTAPDGAAALALAREDPPDLVLSDVMMPELDGFGLLRELRADPVTALVPVVMLSARAGDEATIEGLAAGADDYLIKPFAARELLARVRANLELDRARRVSVELERRQRLLDQAQRLAGVGSWEFDIDSGAIHASEEFVRQIQIDASELRGRGYQATMSRVHPDDLARVTADIEAAIGGAALDYEVRVAMADGSYRTFHTIGELVRHPDGRPARLRGSNQDITEQRRAEAAVAAAAAAQEAAAREHRIADELQRSLLPEPRFTPDHLEVATFYRAGVEGTQVGGDWYDVIELGAGRTALVMGDVMGRGVRAAAVMGQLRAAVRAYARLDLAPADVLEFLDGVVRDLGDDQIVTCVYAVYDPGDRSLVYANAGHLPPLFVTPGEPLRQLTGVTGPPLGAGPVTLAEERLTLAAGALLALYTDGLVEHRDSGIDQGIDLLSEQLHDVRGPLDDVPDALVTKLLPAGPSDDIAILLARITDEADRARSVQRRIPAEASAVQHTREFVASTLAGWAVPRSLAADIVLLASELVANAVLHARPPIELRMRRTTGTVIVEVVDSAPFLPRKLRPTADDERGRGLQLVALLADRWGARPTTGGKAVWCMFTITG
jgi:signal transduction histidine kinase/DNA-binding response OmpR family regulator